MEKKVDLIDNLVKIYRSVSKFPSPTAAFFLKKTDDDSVSFVSSWSQRNLENSSTSKFRRFHNLNGSNVTSFPPVDVSQELLFSVSKSGKYTATIRSITAQGKKKQFLEVWDGIGLYRNFDISAFDVHGDIYTDGEFGCLEWSPDDTKILYVAEKKPETTEPFYKQKPVAKEGKSDDVPSRGGEYVYKEDWGEQLEGKHQPVIAYCDVDSEKINLVSGLVGNYSPGQLIWNISGDGLYGVLLENNPRRLGVIYCTNKPSFIFGLSLTGEFKILSGAALSVRSPRLSDNGQLLFWLQRASGGPHAGCQQLVKYEISNQKTTILVDIVKTSIKINGNKDFYGIYSQRLAKRCFSDDGDKLIFSTPQKFQIKTYVLDLGDITLTEIEDPDSVNVVDVKNNYVLCASGNMSVTSSLKLFNLSDNSDLNRIQWIKLTDSNVVLNEPVIQNLEFTSEDTNDKFKSFNALYLGPKKPSEGKVPLIVFPHGGPHNSYVNNFMLDPAFFVSTGFGVLLVNYRGSLGCGEDSVNFLLGKIGDSDVKDVHQAFHETCKTIDYIDESKVVLYGGSHGGFLICHLSGQFPETYKAVASRNGVIDVSAMYTISDIPDWCTIESGLSFDQAVPPSLDDVNKMSAVSPIRYADKVTAPTLIFIGKKDLRVPFSQGLYFYNTLKARNVKTKLIVYEDNHPLGLVQHEIDHVINSALWFYEALGLTN